MLAFIAALIILIFFIAYWSIISKWIVDYVKEHIDIKVKICELFGQTYYDPVTGKKRCR